MSRCAKGRNVTRNSIEQYGASRGRRVGTGAALVLGLVGGLLSTAPAASAAPAAAVPTAAPAAAPAAAVRAAAVARTPLRRSMDTCLRQTALNPGGVLVITDVRLAPS